MAPYLNMILKADINRIYDEKYLEAEQAKKKVFLPVLKERKRQYRQKAQKKAGLDYNRYGHRFAVLHYYSCSSYNRIDNDVFGKLSCCIL